MNPVPAPPAVPVYDALNAPVLNRIPPSAQSILDLGCGTGALGHAHKKSHAAHWTGVTLSPLEAQLAESVLDRVIVCDLNHGLQFSAPSHTTPASDTTPIPTFDCIIASHILEHLARPEQLLNQLHNVLRPNGCLIAAVPNSLYWRIRLQFLFGSFEYSNSGPLDRTHLRFFDHATFRQLLEHSRWSPPSNAPTHWAVFGGFPASRVLGPLRNPIDQLALHLSPGLFATQFVAVCHPTPTSRAQSSP